MNKSVNVPRRCVQICLADSPMDVGRNRDHPANPLPVRCPHCTFPDIDFVANPYLLAKGVSSPAETGMAEMGNFLVRERARRILEVAVPEECLFVPTAETKSKKPTPWSLAVPKHILELPGYKTHGPPCSKCGEPRNGYIWATPESYKEMNDFDCTGADVFKSLKTGPCTTAEEWREKESKELEAGGLPPRPWADYGVDAPSHPERWSRAPFSRGLYFSLRFWLLFKKAKVRGQVIPSDIYGEPTSEDKSWVEQAYRALAEEGLVDSPSPAGSKAGAATQKWFKQFLKEKAKPGIRKADFSAVEKEQKLALPQDYKDFISAVGPKTFKNVNEEEGFVAKVLPPAKLDFSTYRRGQMPQFDEESAEVDGVMFAETEHGDCFVFDVSAKGADYPVFWFDHESNCMEPFATGFAECIQRFALKS
jgi:hypothetical protein